MAGYSAHKPIREMEEFAQAWCRDEILRRVLTDVANELRDHGRAR
jgi:hypothetical protein